MELLFIKYPVVWLILSLTVPRVIGTKFAIKNVEYQLRKHVEFNFTRVDLGKNLNRIQCSRMCSEDSNCLGVGIEEVTMGEVRCFKMMNDSSFDAVPQDDILYLKGKNFNNCKDK